MWDHSPHEQFDDLLGEDLHAALEATAAELRAAMSRHLVAALTRVQTRGTPLRGAEAFGTDGTVRLRFADGTTVLATGDGKGGLGGAAVAVVRGCAVLLGDVHDDGVGVHAVLVWGRRHRVAIEVLGGDQPA